MSNTPFLWSRHEGLYRFVAAILAMAGVAVTIGVYAIARPLFHGHGLFYLGIVLIFFTGVFSFVVFGLLSSQQRALARANAELARQRDILQGLWDATGLVSSLPDLEAVLQRIVDLARPLFHAEYAALAVLVDQESARIRHFITSGMPDAVAQTIHHLPEGHGLLGEVIRTKRILRVDHIAEHPASQGFPPNHPIMDSFLGVPLLYQGEVVGHLYLTDKPGGFSSQDETLVQLFARQAAVVIANARLYQEREQWVTMQERERIGRDLHDGVLQTLYGTTLALDLVLDSESELSPSARQDLTRISETLGLTMTEIRMFIQTLESSTVDFQVAVRDMLKRLGPMDDLVFEFRDLGYQNFPPELTHDLVMCIQEAVSNARRHGHANRIAIGSETLLDEEEYRVWVADNGHGFAFTSTGSSQQFGLRNMRRRMENWRGALDIDSRSGEGTRIVFRIPQSATLLLSRGAGSPQKIQ